MRNSKEKIIKRITVSNSYVLIMIIDFLQNLICITFYLLEKY